VKVYTVRGCSNHCEAYMHERDTEDVVLAYRPHVEDSYVHLPDHQAALAAKDAALAECVEAMTKARNAWEQGYADSILDEAIAKHRPEEGADNA